MSEDSNYYNELYDYDYDRDDYYDDLTSYKDKNGYENEYLYSKPKIAYKNIKEKVNKKENYPVKSKNINIDKNILNKTFLKNDIYCLKCNTFTKSKNVNLVCNLYNTKKYRITRNCKICNTRSCKFVKFDIVESILKNKKNK